MGQFFVFLAVVMVFTSSAFSAVWESTETWDQGWEDKYTEEVYEAAEAGDSAKVEGLKKDIQRVKSIKPEKKPKEKNKNNKIIMENISVFKNCLCSK